jgi:imidazole glycerol phosphate synthase subunit HisF
LQAQILVCNFEKAGSNDVILASSLYRKTKLSRSDLVSFLQENSVNVRHNSDI